MADEVAIDISAINNTAREMQPKIVRMMMQNIRSTFANLNKYPSDIKHSADLLTFEPGSIMKPFDSSLGDSKNLGIIDKRTLTVDLGMSFIKDEVENYRNTYLSTLDELGISNQAKLPFPAWYLETFTMVGLKDLYLLPYQGVKGPGKTPVDITNGYLKIVKDEITAGNITTGKGNLYELSGAAADYTSSTIGDELKLQWAKLPQLAQEQGVDIHIAWRYKQMYKEWYKNEYSMITDGDVPTEFLDGTDKKARFVWTSAMGTSKRVIFTTTTNLYYGVDKANKEFGQILVFFFQGNPYILAATNKSVIGFQIRTLDASEFVVNNLE